jgi:antitoxin component of MazEF toxin-antitoxin module
MSNYKATVIKTGNSYALRVPKRYVEDAKLELGQKTTIALPTPERTQDREKIQKIIKQLQQTRVYKNVKDPVAWQREVRKDRLLPDREQN